jgi:hypothetical protein
MRRSLLHYFVAGLLAIVLLSATTSFACGPFSLDAIFVYTVHPGYPLERFARGEVGVLQPTYARSYLYVAYRHLTGLNFSQSEQKALTELWKDRLEFSWNPGDEEWIKAWLAARQKVASLPEPPQIGVYRNREKPNEYETYLNCQKDSFDTAIATLNERIAKYGVDNPAVRSWIDAQDQVFANCSEGRHIPVAADASADALARADRSYQIAAANFYSSNFDEARKGFESIADDATSPWHLTAPYLVARTLIRKASLGPDDAKQDSLKEAERQLKKVLTDKKLTTTHAAASRLNNLVRLRLYPSERLHELAHALLVKGQNDDLKQQLSDYTILLDGFLETDEAKPRDELKGDDLSDWISTFQATSVEARDHSLARWRATGDATWFISTLTKVDGQHPNTPELISQALNVKPNSPAFAAARFHAVRLLMESGKTSEACALIDQLLKTNRAQLDPSAVNLLTRQRMLLATSLAEFLNYAPRVPASLSWNDDGREVPTEDSDVSAERKALKGKPLFDEDTGRILNRQFPLIVLKDAAISTELPVELRRDVAQAAWLRAVLLGDSKAADELVPTLNTLVPELSAFLNDYLSAADPDAKRFGAIYAWLKFPGLEPVVDVGIGRDTPLNRQDTYRDNWWCSAGGGAAEIEGNKEAAPSSAKTNQSPLFLSPAQTARGAKEWSTLNALGAAPNYLCRQVIEWATKTPNDPRVPEALHLAVASTRYGCTDKDTGRWSKAAFDLLHRKYPNTSWARKTPYWFKN